MPPDIEFEKLADAAIFAEHHATLVARSSQDHGPRHWRDVARIANIIMPPEADPLVVFYFAALHDTQRANEYEDPSHGERAVRLAVHMNFAGLIALDADRQMLLDEALRDHDVGATSVDQTIGVCWDADRLTLPRVGIRVDLRYISLNATRANMRDMSIEAASIMDSPDLSWAEIAARYEEKIDLFASRNR